MAYQVAVAGDLAGVCNCGVVVMIVRFTCNACGGERLPARNTKHRSACASGDFGPCTCSFYSPLRSTVRTPAFDAGDLGSNPRAGATS
jgi:hypothetical protein